MQRTRHVIAITLVATALCADRVASAAPVLRPQVTSQQRAPGIARQLAERLTGSFRGVMPAVMIHQARREGFVNRWVDDVAPVAPDRMISRCIAPFQFRLPPPTA